MRTNCPPLDSWLKWLRDDLPALDREALEVHLEACEFCSRSMAGLDTSWSLPGQVVKARGAAFGDRTLGVIGRAGFEDEDEDERDETAFVPAEPAIPGLDDWQFVGRGGMGLVFRAREIALDRLVAVKVLAEAASLTPSGRSRAVREAMLMARLRHPNVVPVYRSGEIGGLPFLVMEWVGGGTLNDRIKAAPLAPREAARMVRDLARAVAEAHALGIIHRDLKPENVLIAPPAVPDGPAVPKLTDFGLARRDQDDGVTETGLILGTPGYMAPEQTGLAPELGEVGPLTDVHGLGAILFACLVGHAPHRAETPWESLVRAARGEPIAVRELRRDVPRDLATIAEKCLQTAPSRRYRSSGEVADDLGRFLEGRPIAARAVSAPERWRKWAGRRPALATAMVLLVAGGLAGLGGLAYFVASLHAEQVRTSLALASARSALESLTDDVVQRMVKRGQALDESDRAFLVKVRGFYESSPLEPDPVGSLTFRARGLARLADFFGSIHQDEEALRCREAAIRAYEEAERRGATRSAVVDERFQQRTLLQTSLSGMRRYAEAESAVRKMIVDRSALAARSLDHASLLNRDHLYLAWLLRKLGRPAEAEALMAQGLAGHEKIRLEHPEYRQGRYLEVLAYRNLAEQDRQNGLSASAEARFRKLVELAESALKRFPNDPEFSSQATRGLGGIVSFLEPDRPEEALTLLRRAIELGQGVAASTPDDMERHLDLFRCVRTEYELCGRLGRTEEADADLDQAIATANRLFAGGAAVHECSWVLATLLDAKGHRFEAAKSHREAADAFDRAASILKPWLKFEPKKKPTTTFVTLEIRMAASSLAKIPEHAGVAARLRGLLDLVEPKDRPALELEIASEVRLAEVADEH